MLNINFYGYRLLSNEIPLEGFLMGSIPVPLSFLLYINNGAIPRSPSADVTFARVLWLEIEKSLQQIHNNKPSLFTLFMTDRC